MNTIFAYNTSYYMFGVVITLLGSQSTGGSDIKPLPSLSRDQNRRGCKPCPSGREIWRCCSARMRISLSKASFSAAFFWAPSYSSPAVAAAAAAKRRARYFR
ncbi:hypothetical protein B0F90DRAFT_1761690, partial [Multifurca ochricompacta]